MAPAALACIAAIDARQLSRVRDTPLLDQIIYAAPCLLFVTWTGRFQPPMSLELGSFLSNVHAA
jgi:hypothetical protein